MSYNNKYRDYLSDERPHQRYLSDDYINKGEERTGRRMATGIGVAAAAGVAAGLGYAAWRKGALAGVIRKGISILSDVRPDDMKATFEGIRSFATEDLGKNGLGRSLWNLGDTMKSARKRISSARASTRLRRDLMGDSRLSSYEYTEFEQFLSQVNKARREYVGERAQASGKTARQAKDSFNEILTKHMGKFGVLDEKEQAEMLKRTGVRFATLEDLMPDLEKRWSRLDKSDGMKSLFTEAEILFKDKDFMRRRADANIFVDAAGKIHDLRGARNRTRDIMQSLEADFQVPFVGLNPLRMFRVSEMAGLSRGNQPFVQLFKDHYMQPGLTGKMEALERNIAFMGDKAIDLDTGEVVKEGGRLVRMNSAEARFMRRLGGAAATKYTKADKGVRGWWARAAEALDLGFQDERMKGEGGTSHKGTYLEGDDEEFSWWNPLTYGDAMRMKLRDWWRPWETKDPVKTEFHFVDERYRRKVQEAIDQEDLTGGAQRYGPEEYLWINKAKSVDEAGGFRNFIKQFFPDREHLDEATEASFIPISPYALMDRLEGYFKAAGLGLSTESTGSTGQIFKNLLFKRVAPVIGGVAAWNYLNYESEQIFGDDENPENWAADAYVGASVDLAKLRDAMGITDWAKHTAHLFPGGHHVSELPFVGQLFQLNMSAEETVDYWLNGEDAQRKGRWWELGNTPYVGGQVEYYRANWYRRMKAEVEFTDSLYGSEEEYWEHHWMPTLENPIGPLKKLLDGDWLEEKHAEDRPYPIKGADPLISEFPVLGPLADATVGKLFGSGEELNTSHWAAEGEITGGVPGVVVPGRPGAGPVAMPTHPDGEVVEEQRGSPRDAAGRRAAMTVAYITASGQITPMTLAGAQSIEELEAGLQSASAEMLGMRDARLTDGAPPQAAPMLAEDPTGINGQASLAFENLKQLYGFYGYALDALGGQVDEVDQPELATSRAMTSWRRQFQDMNLGGEDFLFGGDVSEVIRRFWPRENFKDDINPIANTMPDWLPGDGAWTNFRRGDPYVKVANGEERLPGEGYEELYGLRPGQYSPVDKLRILADVAPYSQEFRDMDAQVSALMQQPGGTTAAEEREIREIRRQVREKRKVLNLTPYRFNGKTERREVTVTKVIKDPYSGFMFMTEEMPDNPIKLAGVKVSMSQKDPVAKEAQWWLDRTIHEGARIKIDLNADPLRQVNDDTYRTVSAAVYTEGGKNLARNLLENGLTREDEDDFSAPAVLNRFTALERGVGSLWEKIAHLDTPIHTKFLQVRSPLEQYERQDVYGKSWQTWEHPWDDYVVPTYESFIRHNPLVATALGAALGSFFGKSSYGKLVGGVLGGAAVGAGSLYRSAKEMVTGQTWIPERREKERAVDEYFDILEFLKHQGLARMYADLAKEKEGFDVEAFVADAEARGEQNAARRRALESAKRDLMSNVDPDLDKTKRLLGVESDATDPRSLIRDINREIKALAEERDVEELSPLAAKALQHLQAARKTSYGWNPGDSVMDAMASLGKREKEYLQAFMDAPEEERAHILEVVPLHMRRVLQSQWGMKVDAKVDLQTYFKTRFLPGADWAGWDPGVSMDDIKIKFVNHEAMDRSSFEIWPDDMERARQEPTPIPKAFNVREKADTVRQKLVDILNASGYEEVEVEVLGPARGIQVDIDMKKDKKKELEDYLENNRGGWLG